jgi:hypothetical protein
MHDHEAQSPAYDVAAFKLNVMRRVEVVFLPLQRQNDATNFQSSATKHCRGANSMVNEQSVVYDPEELALLGRILDDAIESLPAVMQTGYNRTEMAKSLLACAATGQRDPVDLQLAIRIDPNVSAAA